MSKFNTSTNYPIIPNAQEYMYETKYLSISSLDINIIKYPNIANFEIELPQDYCNVQSFSLSSWILPNNLNTFGIYFRNTIMTFIINEPYRPTSAYIPAPTTPPAFPSPSAALLEAVYEALYYKFNSSEPNFIVQIEDGAYTVSEMGYELTNQFNYTVSQYINEYFINNSNPNLQEFITTGEYTQFIMTTDPIKQIMCFGNKSSGFQLTNNSEINQKVQNAPHCSSVTGTSIPNSSLYGLSFFLGFIDLIPRTYTSTKTNNLNKVRFFGMEGSSGIWVTPDYNDSPYVFYIYSTNKWNVLCGRYYAYMDISGYNSLDETQEFNTDTFQPTSSKVNSSFAKMPLYTNPNYPENNVYYNNQNIDNIVKVFNPPISRIKKLSIKFKYHNGEYLYFSGETFSFTLKFHIFLPQNSKKMTIYHPEGI